MRVQIDHVVAVGEAYESGADYWTKEQRIAYANDPYVLPAVKDLRMLPKQTRTLHTGFQGMAMIVPISAGR